MQHFGANFETNSPGFFRPQVGDPPENQAKERRKFAARLAAVSKNEADVGKSTRGASPFFETQAHARLGDSREIERDHSLGRGLCRRHFATRGF